MGTPFQGPVPYLAQLEWLSRKGVPEEDHETYEALWAVIAEEMASK